MAAFDYNKLLDTEKALKTPCSCMARYAARIFAAYGCRRVLDLACGNGRDTLYLAGRGFVVTGVDLAVGAVARLREKGYVRCLVADARCLPFSSGIFDAVYAFGLLHVFTIDARVQRMKVMEEVYRVLKPGGLALFTALWTDQPGCGLPELCCLTEAEATEVCRDFQVLRRKLVKDHSCNGWEGIYWRLLMKKERQDNANSY